MSSGLFFLRRIRVEQAYKNTILMFSRHSATALSCSLTIKVIKSMADEVNRWQTSWQMRASGSISCENILIFTTVFLSDSKAYPVFRALYSFQRNLSQKSLHWPGGLSVSLLVSGSTGGVTGATGAAVWSRVRRETWGMKCSFIFCLCWGLCAQLLGG